MTDESEIVEQGEVNPVEEAQGVTADDMLHKNTVSKIVERERQKAFEKGKQEALMQLQQEQQQQMQQPEPPQLAPQQPGNLGGMPQMNPADIERMIAERLPQQLQSHIEGLKNEQMINGFVSKMQAAEAKYPGIEEKLNNLDYSPAMAKVIGLANDMENTGDIMHEILSNPSKLMDLLNMAREQPKLAAQQIASLSNSIKTNQEALAQEKQAQDPMSQLKPSTSAGMDNGAMSVSDFRKMFRT